jgi:putative membrane protein insertion efficiency factor
MKRLVFFTQQAVARVLLGVIEGYRLFVSPLLGTNCRHLPTCSQYAKDAVIRHGPLYGSYYTLKRILRCHPWAKPMLDPVPPVNETLTSAEYTDSRNQRLGE